jgi:predicted RNase H-like HicB family nuclease
MEIWMPTKKRSISKLNRKTGITARQERLIRSYLKLPYSRILIPEEDGRFSAEVLEFSGCNAQGNNAGEAFANLEEAAKSWIAACLRDGKEIPTPSVNYGYSGKFLLRLPRDLHRIASRKAERDAVSLNQCIVTSVAAWVGADNLLERLGARFQRKAPIILNQVLIHENATTASSRVVFPLAITTTSGMLADG